MRRKNKIVLFILIFLLITGFIVGGLLLFKKNDKIKEEIPVVDKDKKEDKIEIENTNKVEEKEDNVIPYSNEKEEKTDTSKTNEENSINKNNNQNTTTNNSSSSKPKEEPKPVAPTPSEPVVSEKPVENKTTPWDSLGISEYDYYNKPAHSWAELDFKLSDYGSREATEQGCKDYGNKYIAEHSGGYWCTSIDSYAGTYLGEDIDFY